MVNVDGVLEEVSNSWGLFQLWGDYNCAVCCHFIACNGAGCVQFFYSMYVYICVNSFVRLGGALAPELDCLFKGPLKDMKQVRDAELAHGGRLKHYIPLTAAKAPRNLTGRFV